MNSIEHLNNKLKTLVEFLSPLLPLANSHLVQFITQDQWNHLLPPNLKNDLSNLPYTKINLIPTAELYEQESEPSLDDPNDSLPLQDFLLKVRSLHADRLNILTPMQELQTVAVDGKKEKLLTYAMSPKKAYEISHMSQIVANISKANKIDWVIDVGGGLGYLSSVLLIQHNLNVFTFDSSSSNILSTLKRSKIIKNLWKHLDDKLLRNKERLKKNKIAAKNWKEDVEFIEEKDKCVSFNAFNGRFIGLTKFITDNENICDLIASRIKQNESSTTSADFDKLGLVGLHTCGNLAPTSLKLFLFNPNMKFLCNVGCCYQLLEEEFIADSFLVNKHATPNDESKTENTTCLDNRYHSIDLDPLHRKESGNSGSGFPLSSYPKTQKFSLGRNARDLASKSVHRLSTTDTNLRPLFWRALLEVIVTDLHGSWPQNAFVGRRTSKISNQFNEYCRKSLENIGLNYELTDEEISEYYDKYLSEEKRLIRFYFLKVALAPIIENIINLDRLIFLHEQGLENSHLVQIFDSAVSPRSTAIISFK